MDNTLLNEGRQVTRAAAATRIVFLIAGTAIAAWSPLVPFVKSGLALDEAQLGLFLGLLGCGSLLGMPVGSAVASKYGCTKPIAVCVLLLAASLPLLVVSRNIEISAALLFVFGAALGGLDCVMNIHGLEVERRAARTLMPGFHGMYSLGGICGSIASVGMLAGNVSPSVIGMIIGIVLLVVYAPISNRFLKSRSSRGLSFSVPTRFIIIVAFICFSLFLIDGVLLNWSALLTVASWAVDPRYAGYAYVIFAVSMTCTRLTGDAIVTKLGARTTVTLGALFAASGLLVIVFAPQQWLCAIGYAIVGIGSANIVPVAFSSIGTQHDVPHGSAVSLVTMCGYSGALTGPAVIGVIAAKTDLRTAFLYLILLLLCVAGLGIAQRWVRRA